jgi:hypothetical protein
MRSSFGLLSLETFRAYISDGSILKESEVEFNRHGGGILLCHHKKHKVISVPYTVAGVQKQQGRRVNPPPLLLAFDEESRERPGIRHAAVDGARISANGFRLRRNA